MRVGLGAGALLALAMVWATAARAADQPLLLVDLPVEGPVSAAAKAAYTTLHSAYDISWPQAQEGVKRYREPAATICTTTSDRQASLSLAEYVRQGGGLLVIVSAKQVKQGNEFLQPLGAQLTPLAKATQQVELLAHPITRQVDNLTVGPIRDALAANALEPIIVSNGATLAAAGMFGSGRLVILPEELLTIRDPALAPNSPQARLLTQAIIWVAFGGTVAPGSSTGPGPADTGPPAAAGLTQKVIADLPDDPAWSAIITAARSQLQALGLPLDAVRHVKGQSSLVAPLQERPALVVLASYRDFEDAESAALAEYVGAGGSLLVLGYGDRASVKQVEAVNKMLGEFGIGYVLGRPKGQVVLKPHPITAGLTSPGEIGPGGSVWAFADWPLALASDCAVASAHEVRKGRIVVFDASTLLPPAANQPAAPEFFQTLLGHALHWLTGK